MIYKIDLNLSVRLMSVHVSLCPSYRSQFSRYFGETWFQYVGFHGLAYYYQTERISVLGEVVCRVCNSRRRPTMVLLVFTLKY